MADRYPLIANSQTNRIEELASGDNLNLQNSSIVGATTVTAQKFVGNLEGTANFSNSLLNGANILSGTISSQRLSGYYPIQVDYADTVDADGIINGTIPRNVLSGSYDINVTGVAQTANYLQNAANINQGIIDKARLTGVYDISITGTSFQTEVSENISIATTNVNLNHYISFFDLSLGNDGPLYIRPEYLTYNPGLNRLGIGTTNPNYNLDIFGNVNITDSLSIGSSSVLTSARQLQNISSIDETTRLTFESALQLEPNNFNSLNVTGISTLGVVNATTINKVTITPPATSATITIADGKSITASNTLTFTGVDTSSVNFGTGGIVAYRSNKLNVFSSTTSSEVSQIISDYTGSPGSLVFSNSPTFTGIVNVENINSSIGVITATQFSTGASGVGVNINTNTISGPAEITIDPAAVGNNTGAVRIKGDLYVDGTQTYVNSTTIELADFNVGIATTVGSDLLLNGAGIGIGSTGIRKTLTWDNANTALKSSENFNLANGKVYEIDGNTVLSSTTLGSGVINSSLISVGTLEQLNVSGVTTLGITSTTNLNSQRLNVSGIGTFGEGIKVNSGGINVTGYSTFGPINAGVVTVTDIYGSGQTLSGIVTQIVAGIGITLSSTQIAGKGVVTVDAYSPVGKTIFVTQNGNNTNSGLTESDAKRNVKDAVEIANSGDTIKVFPGVYIEDNPIVLPENVSIEGAELRNCIITPQNPGLDLFHVTNGTHLTDLSFQGQSSTNGAAVVAFKPLVGVSSNRFFDAARIIRYNLDFIAAEAVGYLTSTNYKNPAFTLSGGDYTSCKDDIKDIFRAVCHDITRGGNSRCVGAGLSYYTGSTLQHIVGVKTETIDTIRYAAGIAQSCINNVQWTGNYQNEFTQIRDLSIQADGSTGSNSDINSCSNVVSAIYSCVGVVTTIIDQGPGVVGTSFNLTYPGGVTNPNDIPSQGVGNVTKGPYIRNCTNFIPNSIGMKVDGFHAEPGDKDDMGITGMMSVDSYTQYNQGGIGVSITNGAYAQLVSIFTICDDTAIYTASGGQCDITNSNSSFGTRGLVSDGVSSPNTKSVYRYTGNVGQNSSEGDLTFVITGIGKEKPYSGQALYFGELYYEIVEVVITNPGSGYSSPPTINFATPTGPSEIIADAFSTIENGSVTAVNMIGNGRNYKLSDNPTSITFSVPQSGTNVATGYAVIRPLYYQVRSATDPVAGVSTVTLAQQLNNNVGVGTTVFLFRQSLQIVSSHSFEYVGAGNTIELARPSKGGITIQANEVVKLNGGEVVYTSTDQDGNFAIGEDLVIDQATGTIRGRAFERSLLNTVTPFIIALGAK